MKPHETPPSGSVARQWNPNTATLPHGRVSCSVSIDWFVSPELFMILVLATSLIAGLVGSLTGLGGGIILTPILVLGFGVDLRYAVGASLIAVVATSSGAAAAYVREGWTNVRLAMVLEVATVFGAIAGALLAARVPVGVIALIFGVMMLWTAWSSRTQRVQTPADVRADGSVIEPDTLATRLRLHGIEPKAGGAGTPYLVHHLPAGFAIMFGAGVLSALIGIGSGIVKVLAMDKLMKLPFKVSTTTSNFMIGVTAAASAGVYLHRGQVEPGLAAPVAIGALAGAFVGAKILPKAKVKTLRIVFAIIVAAAGLQMIYKGASMVGWLGGAAAGGTTP